MLAYLEKAVFELTRQFRWSFLPPLMVYFAAGIAGITGIVGTFFVKDYLGLSASFLAELAFWAGLPWVLKMPLGHLVDIVWRWKAVLVYIGAGLIALSLSIMYALVVHREEMETVFSADVWYVIAVLLAPCGYVIQDAVADAMSVEAVPLVDDDGNTLSEHTSKNLHTTMQTLGRASLFVGLIAVALLNTVMFEGIEDKTEPEKVAIYGQIYLMAMFIPIVSISGVLLASFLRVSNTSKLRREGLTDDEISKRLDHKTEETKLNPVYFYGGAVFAIVTVVVGLSSFEYSKEVIFLASMVIVIYLMRQLAGALTKEQAYTLFGTAIILFMFRAIPAPGPGVGWFEIDELGFNQQCLSLLSLITAVLTLVGMLLLRPMMVSKSISFIVIVLTFAGAVLSLPNIGLYYGVHNWTASVTGGVVDAHFIAILDTALESPLGQIAIIPILAWIAKYAPMHLKATFFAVMASFVNLALAASNLLTSYINKIFVVSREVVDQATNEVTTPKDYSELGILLIVVLVIGLTIPLVTIAIVQRTRFRSSD